MSFSAFSSSLRARRIRSAGSATGVRTGYIGAVPEPVAGSLMASAGAPVELADSYYPQALAAAPPLAETGS